MSSDPESNAVAESVVQAGPVTLINIFHPKPGKLEEFIALQIEEAQRLGSSARKCGWRGNRIHRSRDGALAVIVTSFDSVAGRDQWAKSALFADHLERISPLLERVDSHECDVVAGFGTL